MPPFKNCTPQSNQRQQLTLYSIYAHTQPTCSFRLHKGNSDTTHTTITIIIHTATLLVVDYSQNFQSPTNTLAAGQVKVCMTDQLLCNNKMMSCLNHNDILKEVNLHSKAK